MRKQVSCGVIFINTNKKTILMVHPTNQKEFWDFPKGKREEGETPLEAAIREVFEETSLVVDENELVDCGEFKYNNQKNIHLFFCFDKEFSPYTLKCTSLVEKDGQVFPEVDEFEFFNLDDAISKMCPSMKKVFIYELKNKIEYSFKN